MAKIAKLLLVSLIFVGYTLALQKIRCKADLAEHSSRGKPILIKAYMTGCPACQMIAADIEKLQVEYPEVIFLEAELSENSELAMEEAIAAAPTFLFYKAGASKPHDRVVGANKPAVEAKIKELISDKDKDKDKDKKAAKAAKGESKKKTQDKKTGSKRVEDPKKKASSALQQIKSKADLAGHLSKGKPILIKAYMNGCGACQMIASDIEKLQIAYPEVIFLAAELSENPELVMEEAIAAAPTFLFYKAGASKPHDRVVGANKPAVESKIKELISDKHKDKDKRAAKEESKKKTLDKKTGSKRVEEHKKKVFDRKAGSKKMETKKAVRARKPIQRIKKAPVKRPVPLVHQKAKRDSKQFVEEQISGKGCKTQACGSCETCSTCGCNPCTCGCK